MQATQASPGVKKVFQFRQPPAHCPHVVSFMKVPCGKPMPFRWTQVEPTQQPSEHVTLLHTSGTDVLVVQVVEVGAVVVVMSYVHIVPL